MRVCEKIVRKKAGLCRTIVVIQTQERSDDCGVVAKMAKRFLIMPLRIPADAAGPVNADETGASRDALAEEGPLDAAAKGEVFDDLHAQRAS